nr:phage tail length tape measure family protein [Novosphingobium panipatense]
MGFAIEANGSLETLRQIQSAMDTAQGKIFSDASKIERATGGMLKLGGVTAEVTTFSHAATRELASVARETNKAERSAEAMVRQLERQVQTFGKSTSEIRQMRAEMRATEAESRGLSEVAARLRAVSSQMDLLEKRPGRTRSSMTQLSFQLNDVATMAMSGSNAMQIFGTQAGQIFQVAQQAEGGVKGFAAELGTVALRFAPLAALAAATAAGIGIMSSEINKNSTVTVSWMDTALGAFDAVKAGIADGLTGAFAYFGTTSGAVWTTVVEGTKWAINRILGYSSMVPRAIKDTWSLIPAGVADIFLSAVNYGIDAINLLIRKSVTGVNGFIAQANSILAKADLALPALTAPQIGRLANGYAGAGAKLGSALVKSIGDTMTRDFVGDAAKAISPFAQARARKRAEDDAEKAGKAAGAKLGKSMADKAADDFLTSLKKSGLAEFYSDFLADQERQWKQFQDEVGRMDAFRFAEQGAAAERAREEADAYAGSLADIVSLFDRMGGQGRNLGGIFGVLTGSTAAVGGALGDLLNISVGSSRDDQGRLIARTIGSELSEVFGQNGSFGKTMARLFEGGATGALAGGLLFGRQSGAEQLGSAIGGAIGGKVGEKFLSKGLESVAKGLGDFAGPLGSIAGGIVGNVVGGMLKSVKWGRVDLSASGVSSASGNSGSSRKAALAAGNSIFGSLEDIASQLGGAVSDFGSFAIGVRHGDYRVNTNGTSLKKKKGAVDFDDDAEAAALYALQQAINRGAIAGIRGSTSNLLKAGDDLQANLNKALQFEGVFSELKSRTDPVGYELESLAKQFDQLRGVFAQAGASAEEYAQLEQLLALKRSDVLQKERDALDDVSVRIARAQGNEAAALAIERQQELAGAMNDAVRAELQRLYAVEDAVSQQQQLTEELRQQSAAAESLKEAWASVGETLMDEVERIRGITDGTATGSFAVLQGQFNAATVAARAGDQGAASKLVELSQALISVAGNTATSRQELERVKAQTAASLEATYGLIGVISGAVPATSQGVVSAAAAATAAAPVASSMNAEIGATIEDLRGELAAMRRDLTAGNAAIAGNTARIANTLRDVTDGAGGRAVSVAGVA